MVIKERINNTLKIIEQYCSLLILNQEYAVIKYVPVLVESLSSIFPDIIAEYEKEYLLDKKDEQQYWIDQIGRITEAIDNNDFFFQLDVLLNETAENLRYFCDLLK